MKFKFTAVAAALLVTTASHAAFYDFGPHVQAPAFESSSSVGGGNVSPGSILDGYSFGLSSAEVVSSLVVAINQSPSLSITDGTYLIYSAGPNGVFDSGPGGDDFVVPGTVFAFDGSSGATAHSVLLGPGKYAYLLQGTASGTNGGAYFLASNASPVPEPGTLVLLASGVFAFGWRMRHRANPR
jgi:hypothetical protein